MKSIAITDKGPQLQHQAPVVNLEDNEVIVAVKAVSICRTDIYAAEGKIKVKTGRILGHEFTGIVSTVGSRVTELKVGDRVVGNPSFHCRLCQDCQSLAPHLCGNTTFLGLDYDGAFAEQVVVPAWSLFPLPNKIPFDVGTFVEPVAAGLAILEAGLSKQSKIAVYGSGRIADLSLMILHEAGFKSVSSLHPKESLSKQFDAVIETCGLHNKMALYLQSLRPGGTLVVKSREPRQVKFPILGIIQKRIRLIGVKYGPFEQAIEFVANHIRILEAYLDSSYSLDNFTSAFEQATNCENKKLCFQINH